MPVLNKLTMINFVVSDMRKAKEFYAEKLGLEIATDYRQDDNNWWVSFTLPGGGASMTLARHSEHMKPPAPGSVTFYFSTPDIAAAQQRINGKGVKTSEIMDDLYGPGSGVKFFSVEDPDGNSVTIAQAESGPDA